MSYSGKPTFAAGSDLPEIMEDVSDLVGIVSPYETPLLDYLGDAKRPALSTIHEWMEDTLLPNSDSLNQTVYSPDAQNASSLTVQNGSRFQVGDLVRPDASTEVMQVTAVAGAVLTVVRGYGSTTKATLANGKRLFILGNAALEGADATNSRFTLRARKANYTQIFSSTVEVSGSMRAARQHGIDDELEYQKQERLRELLRDLENCVINGVAPASNPQGSSSIRRSMNGIIRLIGSNQYVPNSGGIPTGGGSGTDLNEPVLNAALRLIWEQSQGKIDTIVCSGALKRRINGFATGSRAYTPEDKNFRDMISTYESDFGVCRVILSRWVPSDSILLLDSSRISVLPLQGRSFGFKPLAQTGDANAGQVLGEYTLEFKNENAHGVIRGLT
ncbi:MAG: SU10 major capsid protein [Phycisphaerales bacterium]